MGPIHLVYSVALIIAGAALVWRIRKGQLNGRARTGILFAYGLFVLAWIAKASTGGTALAPNALRFELD